MIELSRKEDCCGCSVCAAVCPKHCIKIEQDFEGFYYPKVDENVCVSCGLCEKKCPVINNKTEIPFVQTGFVVQNKDLKILKESTSGGAFTSFAEYVVKKNGVVIGAALNEDMFVEHIIVDNVKDLFKFRNSKYVQSYISPDIYNSVKDILLEGKIVCFSGTGCQIEALRNFLGNKVYENLYCIDVVCRAVPSPLALKKYLEYQTTRKHAEIESLRFRDKHFGYQFSTVNIGFKGVSKHYHRGIESDPWHRAFFSGICNRPSCHECVFKKRYRVSDITIWDCFDYEKFCSKMIRNMGATNVLIHSERGQALFESVIDSFVVEKANPDNQVAKMKEMTNVVKASNKRSLFMADAQLLDGVHLYEKYFPIDLRNNAFYYGRCLAAKIGIYAIIKSIMRKN